MSWVRYLGFGCTENFYWEEGSRGIFENVGASGNRWRGGEMTRRGVRLS